MAIRCPFCGADDCAHFIGFTENGRIIDLNRGLEQISNLVQESDRVVTTGVSARVYRERIKHHAVSQ